MKIAVVGTGYVGLVSGACFGTMGNTITCVDVDQDKIAKLQQGIIPIYEPRLEKMVTDAMETGGLCFTTKLSDALKDASICLIAVGTPMGEDGSADLTYVLAVAKEIGQFIDHQMIIVDKSTVPVGTADKVRSQIAHELAQRGVDIEFSVVSNPEFLKEGSAVNGFMRPDRVIIGADDAEAINVMRELYEPFVHNHDRIIEMDVKSAEMTKYAANAMLATKISFMNEKDIATQINNLFDKKQTFCLLFVEF